MAEEKKRGGGPKTASGKAKSSENSAKHGMRSKQLRLAEDETQEAFDEHRANWWSQFEPYCFLEKELVEQMIFNHWLMLRGNRRYSEVEIEGDQHTIELMQRYKTTAERAFYRSWAAVRQLRGDFLKYQSVISKMTWEKADLRRKMGGADGDSAMVKADKRKEEAREGLCLRAPGSVSQQRTQVTGRAKYGTLTAEAVFGNVENTAPLQVHPPRGNGRWKP